MPFWQRVKRASRKVAVFLGLSRSPPIVLASHPQASPSRPADNRRKDLREPSSTTSGYGSAPPVSQGTSDTIRSEPLQAGPSPDSTSRVPQSSPTSEHAHTAPTGVSQEPSDSILAKAAQDGPSPDSFSKAQETLPTSGDSVAPVGTAQKTSNTIHSDPPQEAPSPDTTSEAPQQTLPMSEHGEAPIAVSQGQSDIIPAKATKESLSLHSTRRTHHEEPVTTTTTGPSGESQSSASKTKPASTWYTALKTTVDLVVQVSDVFPSLKSMAAGIKALVDVHDAFSSNQEEFEKLALRVAFLEKILRDRETLPPGIADRRDGLARAAEDLGKELKEKTSQSNFKRVVFANEDKQEVLRLIREINFAIEFALLDVALTNEGLTLRAVEGINWLNDRVVEDSLKVQKDLSAIARDVRTLRTSDRLKKLGSVKGYGLSPDAPQCVAGSRVALIARLLAWAEDPSSVHAFWLSGMAGTGKTAVSRTFCHQLIKRGLLGASFFCSIKVEDLSDVRNIIPSLAKTLAERYPGFGDALADVLESGAAPLVDEMKLSEQYDFLIIRPSEAALRNLDKNIILCADALDECRAPAALKEFLNTILSKEPVGRLKFFFTSRPEVAIRQTVESPSHSLHRKSLRLHDIEKDVVRSDIRLYVNHELRKIPELQDKYAGSWPPPEVDQIVERADTLFIVAATIIRRISGDDKAGNPVGRLTSFGKAGTSNGVQQLYVDILEYATAGLEDPEKKQLHSCLSLLVAARRPLSLNEYAALLVLTVSDVATAFRSLHSVVEMPAGRDDNRAISIYHASFVDFLTGYSTTTDTRQASPPWAVNVQEAHSMAFEWCLALMESEDHEKGLFLGVSGARTSYCSNEDQQLPQLRSDLGYACTAWGNHALDGMVMLQGLQRRVKVFLETKGLYWLEALSAERSVGYANILWEISKTVDMKCLAKLLVDIRDFAQMFGTPITHSTPHLYLSAVPFQRSLSPESVSWLPHIPSIPIVYTTQGSRHTNGRKLAEVGSPVLCLDVSPDGSRVVMGTSESIQILNMQSGELVVGPMEGHSDCIRSVIFSPDGTRIVSGSDDKTIRIWDTQSGALVVGPMEGHSSGVRSVALSPDGTRIVSGSNDKTIRVWDAQSGALVVSPLVGHSNMVSSVAFSPDGTRIVSGSGDKTIRIWDAQSGALVVGPVEGHSSGVSSVAFSPDGTRIVSGPGDKTIRVWDAQSGALMVGPMEGHSQAVSSVVFSPNGTRIISGSHDKTIQVWDAQSGALVVGPMEGGSYEVNSVAFSPDGTKLVSGSDDKAIRVWNADSGALMVGPMEGHSKAISSVTFSPDGTRILSGSRDKTIQVSDAQSGALIVGPMEGHSQAVSSVTFSPDGTRIVSASNDKTIRVWDAQSGALVVSPLVGHSNMVSSVAFSPDGTRIVSGSSDKTIRIWDAQSGALVVGPMEGHSSGVRSVAFSPDGTRIVSGSGDKTIHVWDVQSGALMVGPMEGHSQAVHSVAFSPDGTRIVSGSRDKTIRVWDVQSGALVVTVVPIDGGVTSVAFSPDGTRIVSGSWARTIQVWDAQNAQAVADLSYLYHYHSHNIPMGDDGWIRNLSNDLLLWVPPHLRSNICLHPLQLVIPPILTTIDLSHALYHGTTWQKCTTARQETAPSCLPWPIRSDPALC